MTTLVVPTRFRGPTASANGGYICGRIAMLAPAPVTVRLLKPPPLDTELEVMIREDRIELRHRGDVLAETLPGEVDMLEAPPCPTREAVDEATRRYAGFERHPAPECFVCGPERAAGDGLRIFCGPLVDKARELVSGPWAPDASLAAGDGRVGTEIMWAAVDCPGYAAVAPDMRCMLLGELTVRVDRHVAIGEPCTAIGWAIASKGRKHEAGAALYGAAGDLCAIGRAIWIEPRAESAH
jgi:hypothetical protein